MFRNLIIGDDVEGKARSPLIWNAFYEKNSLNESLIPKNISKQGLELELHRFLSDPFCKVLVIAKPYKTLVLEFFPKEMLESQEKRDLSSVNLAFKRNEKIQLYSTDGYGFLRSLESDKFAIPEITTILGYGATSKSIIDQILYERVDTQIEVYTRKPVAIPSKIHKEIRFLGWESLTRELKTKKFLVNATTVGNSSDKHSSVLSPQQIKLLNASAYVKDVNYLRDEVSQLERLCKNANIDYTDGLKMNFYQAVSALTKVYPTHSLDFDFNSVV
jgi:shikimate 5-dehydrogenase